MEVDPAASGEEAGRAAAGDAPATIVDATLRASGSEPSSWPWHDDEYLLPVLAEDPLLYSLAPPGGSGPAAAARHHAKRTRA